jgi:hypothetical protein
MVDFSSSLVIGPSLIGWMVICDHFLATRVSYDRAPM